uniref:Uncharacterized protein n=1 Tax=Alexandrium monilatum TaxID=311494 RepID=A0A7S4Q573_9DINO|mmetsp:Transcript_90758/g.270914  ORF Transcript_90758/g.270914 Transcript_90758/m.270914 type:complete len:308 (-) Transcript_90758:81-1004(-)
MAPVVAVLAEDAGPMYVLPPSCATSPILRCSRHDDPMSSDMSHQLSELGRIERPSTPPPINLLLAPHVDYEDIPRPPGLSDPAPSTTSGRGQPIAAGEAQAPPARGGAKELVASVIQSVLGDDFPGLDGDMVPAELPCNAGILRRWWTRPTHPLLCPLTGFPVNLLPYPPFKLRSDASKPTPYKLVDGKFLAMAVIVDSSVPFCGRNLQVSDLHALDLHIHRCKLGPFKPARLMELQRAVAEATTAKAKAEAMQGLVKFRIEARAELGKLRKIQESRLIQLQLLPGGSRRHRGEARGSRRKQNGLAS